MLKRTALRSTLRSERPRRSARTKRRRKLKGRRSKKRDASKKRRSKRKLRLRQQSPSRLLPLLKINSLLSRLLTDQRRGKLRMPKSKALMGKIKIKLLMKNTRRRRRGRKRRRRRRRSSQLRRFIVQRLSLLSNRRRKLRFRLQCQLNQSLIPLKIKLILRRRNPSLPLHLLLTQCSNSNSNSNSSLPMVRLNQSISSPSCHSSTRLSSRTPSPSRPLPPTSSRCHHPQASPLHLATSSIPLWMF